MGEEQDIPRKLEYESLAEYDAFRNPSIVEEQPFYYKGMSRSEYERNSHISIRTCHRFMKVHMFRSGSSRGISRSFGQHPKIQNKSFFLNEPQYL